MMAPVIVCVVLTGMPKLLAPKSVIAPAVSAANPPNGCSFVIFEPIVCTMRQPPVSVPSAMAACAARMTQSGIENSRQIAGREQQPRDDAHRLLRVVGAVAEAVGGCRQQLQPAEPLVDARRPEAAEHPQA